MVKINQVIVKKLKVYKDKPDLKQPKVKPGIFLEVLKDTDKIISKNAQSNFSIAYQGTIKAFHHHKYQDDLWFVASGRAAIVLYDGRKKSSTYGKTQVIYAGDDDYKLVLVPSGVIHGYKVLSKEPCLLFYHVTKKYNRQKPDELRLDPFDKGIGFDWEGLK